MLSAVLCLALGCRVVTFLSGGKCGSTALASFLKHQPPTYAQYDHDSPFEDTGKELCGRNLICNRASHILDACPRRITNQRARQTLATDRDAVGVLIVRDQASALLSLYRDAASSGSVGGLSADQWVLANMHSAQYNFTDIFYDAVRWGFARIAVVASMDVRNRPGFAVNKIRTEAGLPTVPFIAHSSFNAPVPNNARYRNGELSYATRQRVEHHWHDTNLQLAILTGVII